MLRRDTPGFTFGQDIAVHVRVQHGRRLFFDNVFVPPEMFCCMPAGSRNRSPGFQCPNAIGNCRASLAYGRYLL